MKTTQHSIVSPITYYVRTPTDMTYIVKLTPKHSNKCVIRKEYVQHAPTLLDSNRVAGSIPKIRFVCIYSRIRFYSATNMD